MHSTEPQLPRFNPTFYDTKRARADVLWIRRRQRRAFWNGVLAASFVGAIALITIALIFSF
jgi:hypothetical protein